jgi:hypothetical protein
VNRRDLRERLYGILGENPANPFLFTDAELNRHLNDAYQEMARETRALDIRSAITTTAEQGTYSIPEECGRVYRVAYDNYALFPETAQRLDWLDQTWTSRTGQPERWMRDRLDERQLRIWPAPTSVLNGFDADAEVGLIYQVTNDDDGTSFDSEVGLIVEISDGEQEEGFDSEYGLIVESLDGDIEVWSTKVPGPLDEDTDEPEFPEHAQMGIVFRAAETALSSMKESQNLELAKVCGQLARDYYEELARLAGNKQSQRAVVVGRPATFRPRYLRRETHIEV